jgi:hypothetical protein
MMWNGFRWLSIVFMAEFYGHGNENFPYKAGNFMITYTTVRFFRKKYAP